MNDIPETVKKQPVQVKVSRLAIASIGLAMAGSILIIACSFSVLDSRFSGNTVFEAISASIFGISAIGVILGIVSFIRIEAGGGKITGRKYAVGAMILPIFAFLLPIFYIGISSERNIAFRKVCGSRLSVLGMCMNIYANDYNDKLPQAGGKDSTWGTSINWDAPNRSDAYRLNPDGTGGTVTISSSLYLLYKYTSEVHFKEFICPGDSKVSGFYLSGSKNTWSNYMNLWDFGPKPWKHYSYSYHMPYGQYSLTTSSNSGMAVAADRNPWIPSLGWKVKDFNAFDTVGGKEMTKKGNSPCHQDEGQNVLFLDSHVDFETVSFCGLNEDNIYTSWNGTDIRKGTPPKVGSQPADKMDSLLMNDPPIEKP